MLDTAREYASSHRDLSRLVRDAQRFSVNVPVIGKIAVPPPDQLAFYGVLTVLGITELIPWPVAAGLGIGHALATRYATGAATEAAEEAAEEAVEEAVEEALAGLATPAKKTAVKKAPVAKKAVKAPAKKAPAKKAAAKKAPAKKTPAKRPGAASQQPRT